MIGRSVGPEGAIEGLYDNSSMLNFLLCNIEFPNSQVKEYSAYIIAENMLYRVDSDGFLVTMLEVIKDYAKDDTALDIANKYVVTPKGRQRLWKTNKG